MNVCYVCVHTQTHVYTLRPHCAKQSACDLEPPLQRGGEVDDLHFRARGQDALAGLQPLGSLLYESLGG